MRNSKIQKRNLKIFLSRTTGPFSTNFGTKFPWVNGIQVCSNKEPFKEWSFSTLNQGFNAIFSVIVDLYDGPANTQI